MSRKRINNNGKLFWLNVPETSSTEVEVKAEIVTTNNEIKELVFEEKQINIEPQQVELADDAIEIVRTSKKSKKPRKPRRPRGSKIKE